MLYVFIDNIHIKPQTFDYTYFYTAHKKQCRHYRISFLHVFSASSEQHLQAK